MGRWSIIFATFTWSCGFNPWVITAGLVSNDHPLRWTKHQF